MKIKNLILIGLFVILLRNIGYLQANTNTLENYPDTTVVNTVQKWLNNNNLSGFIENQGQMKDTEGHVIPEVLYKSESPNINFWITETGFVIQVFRMEKVIKPQSELTKQEREEAMISGKQVTKKYFYWERIDVELIGSTIRKDQIVNENPLQGYSNYFYAHCPDGVFGVQEYGKVTVKDVYPGIDWVFYRKDDGSLKYDFVVHPGADYQMIQLKYRSKQPLVMNEKGQLELYTSYGNIYEEKPVSYYKEDEIHTQYIVREQEQLEFMGENCYETTIGFKCDLPNEGELQLDDVLIVDPQLFWATFRGGSSTDGPFCTEIDANGNIFVAGYSHSVDMPTMDPGGGAYFQGTHAGGSGSDIYIWKFGSNGSLVWSTYYGGTNSEIANGITIDPSNDVIICGHTYSSDLPVFDFGGSAYYQGTLSGTYNAFFIKFDNNGVRKWATYYGGSGYDVAYSITSDASGNIISSGQTTSANFPVLDLGGGAYFDNSLNSTSDAFIIEFNSSSVLQWATYYGGSGGDYALVITTNQTGDIFLTGKTMSSNSFPLLDAGTYYDGSLSGMQDVFISKLSNSGVLLWSTLYGGTSTEEGRSIKTDNLGNVFVIGTTASSIGFGLLDAGGGAYYQSAKGASGDAFILKFSETGVRQWATYYGGNDADEIDGYNNLAINSCGNVCLAFHTRSSNLPTLSGCDAGYLKTNLSGTKSQYLSIFDNNGVMLWGTYFGGDGLDFRSIASFYNDNLYLTGEWTEATGLEATYPLVDPGGGAYFDNSFNGLDDTFISIFNMDVCYCVPLPVELTVFNGKNEGTVNKVYWETMSELNCDYYELQRAIPNSKENSQVLQWNTIGIIEGSGTTSIESNYEFYDDTFSKEASVVYYRLNQVDYNGSTELFGPIAINLHSSDSVFDLFPNPVTNELNIHIQGTYKGNAIIVIENVIGQEIACYPIVIEDTNFLFSINIEWLNKGIYFIKFKTDDGVVSTEKLVVK